MNTIGPVKVLIVEDHPTTRAGLALVLASFPDLELLGQVASGEDALTFIATRCPDVVVMDIRLPGMDGVATTQEIVGHYPQVRVVVLTSYLDSNLIERVLEAGALSYLLKDVTADEIAAAIRAARSGQGVMSPAATEVLARSAALGGGRANRLTEREREVLQLMADGFGDHEIADQLQLAPSLVRSRVDSVLAKLGTSSRAIAIDVAWQQNLLQ